MQEEFTNRKGLSDKEVEESRARYGKNILKETRKTNLSILKEGILEPMFLLLVTASTVYFLVGEFSEGFIMLFAMLFVLSISFYQERRSMKALDQVKRMSQPKATVIRNYKTENIDSDEIVTGDILLIEEGEQIPADGELIEAHDFSVDESLLTGESVAVSKNEKSDNKQVYLGATVRTGNAVVRVSSVGIQTMLGKLGKSIEDIKPGKSRFQKEIQSFVKRMAIAGAFAFLLVLGINYFETKDFLSSLLYALALAMSILPEEIPVAFSTFMALGAWRLLKKDVLVKDSHLIETLGSATMICIDKTGTITENKMTLSRVYSFADKKVYTLTDSSLSAQRVVTYAMWSSEPSPFDLMEIAIHEAYDKIKSTDERNEFEMIHEYPLSGKPPVMTHIYENKEKQRIIACKGGPESVVQYSNLSKEDASSVLSQVKQLASEGYRVLGVASAGYTGYDFPEEQKDFDWEFEGLVVLYDPPKTNIKEVLNKFYKAHIKVKIISGDYATTTQAIAKEIDFAGGEDTITGAEVNELDNESLKNVVTQKNIFARMFPEAKLRVINALKENGEIVAMTGDGVNDGPALKSADIGVSMGSKGTEIARRASSIVLLDNDLDKMYFSIIAGRKIYVNLKKAVRYILSIHIAIITAVTGPLLLGWDIINIFSPVHIIFFELIMGPTCSIVYENEPVENGIKNDFPRSASSGFLTMKELLISIIQGAMISIGVLTVYYMAMKSGYSKEEIRTMVFLTIAIANIFLTLENRSFEESIFKTFYYKNSLIAFIIVLSVFLLTVILALPPARKLFLLAPLTINQLLICTATAFISVIWMEIYKLIKKWILH